MKSKIFCALSLLLFGISFMSAQQSCYEQYLRAHNMPLPTDSMTVDDSYDELKKEVIARQLMRNERTFVSQPIRQPLLLVIDTLDGTCHLLAEDGTILADVHLAMVDSTWYMWLSVDPLADKYPGSTPYLYCNGNPIMFIDPDGRDVWELNDNGTIKKRVVDKTQDAIAVNGKSISFDYGTIDMEKYGRERGNINYTYFQFSKGKENEAAAAFKFLADNSSVEYALVNTDKNISGVYTNHKKDDVFSGFAAARVEGLTGAKMTNTYHSHSNGTEFPSGLNDGKGDIRFAKNKGDSYNYYIYPAKSDGVIEYFSNGSYISMLQPWPYKTVGTISPYVRQSGIPALLRKLGIKL